jgi:hypothetical protein
VNPRIDIELWVATANSGQNLDATYNWWATTDPLQISNRIWDNMDDSSKLLANYIPFLETGIFTTLIFSF